jgi:poly(3-hydroxybutyrate) depolymerase
VPAIPFRSLLGAALLAAGFLSLQSPPARASEKIMIDPGAGRFLFQDPKTATGKTLPVWTYRPKNFTPDTPILFVMHGVNRNADDYRDNWIALAEANNLLIVAPEFGSDNFPKAWAYNLGNVMSHVDADGTFHPAPQKDWSFPIIERIFAAVRAATGSRRTTFSIFGHSAGAQFVHRYLTFTGGPKLDLAIAANAGWYTLPTGAETFPYGLGQTAVTDAQLKTAFGKKLIILLGEADTKQDRNLRQTAEAMRQGPTRLDRGKNYFETARKAAEKMGVPFNWRMVFVPGVGHSNAGMAGPAAALVMKGDKGGG